MSLDSAHRLVVGDARVPKITTPRKHRWKIIETQPLKDTEIRGKHKTKMTVRLEGTVQKEQKEEEKKCCQEISNTRITVDVAEHELQRKLVEGSKKKKNTRCGRPKT